MNSQNPVLHDPSRLTDDDIYLFNEGSHCHLDEKLGAYTVQNSDLKGTHFAVWAPDAVNVSLIGDFNDWNKTSHPLRPRESSGIWEVFIPEVGKGTNYKYYIVSRFHDYSVEKADPLAIYNEEPPKTASVVWDLAYE